MDVNNLKHYKLRFGDESLGKIEFLPNLIGLDKIKDPGFSEGLNDYRIVFNQILECCIELNKIL